MERVRFVTSFLLSLSVHWLILLGARVPLLPVVGTSGEPITIDLVGDGTHTATATAPPVAAPAPPPEPAPVVAAPPPPRPVKPPRVVRPRPLPAVIDGVRLATADDVRARILRERRPVPARLPEPPPPPSPPLAPPPPPAPPPAEAVEPPALEPGSGESTVASTGAEGKRSGGTGSDPEEGLFWKGGVLYERRVFHRGRGFRPDAPGYQGRIFGQVSVQGAADQDGSYGRIHLFQDDGVLRDYSGRSLFGYSFRQELGGGAVRDFQVGRVQTHGAYLMVTDLFADGRLSSMSHTVLLTFPRQPPAGQNLYDVVEEGQGTFRLRGPNGAALVFDERTRGLRAASGFIISPQGEVGTPPRVAYGGLHVRLQAIGGNPFLRDRAAAVVDARGVECATSTSDLFAYDGRRRESDMFRYPTDRDFFAFLAERCPGLALPRPAAPRVVARAAKPQKKEAPSEGGLFGVFR